MGVLEKAVWLLASHFLLNLTQALACLTLITLDLEGGLTPDQMGHGLNPSGTDKGSELDLAFWADLAVVWGRSQEGRPTNVQWQWT